MRGRILVVDHRTPMPDQDSGSASAFSYLKILSRSGLVVTFAPFNLAKAGRYTQALDDLGIKTLSAPEWPSMDAVIETLGPRSDILLLYRAPFAAQLFDLARRAAPAAKILFHPVDLHFLRMQREAALTGDGDRAESAHAMRAIELDLIARADVTIVVSAHEFCLLRELLPEAALHQIPILRETPSSCSEPARHRLCRRFFTHGPGRLGRWLDRRGQSFEKRRDLLFIGSYEHPPNVDAVLWFVREVWPAIQSRGFAHRFIIAGSKPPDEIAALASDKIAVIGHVGDLGTLFAACRLSVAPLRYGGGIKGKIVTSLSYGLPVVATSIAAEGMGLSHEQDILLADAADAMADQIMRLYDDPDLWQRLSSNGCQAFQDKFSLTAGAGKVLAVLEGLLASAAR